MPSNARRIRRTLGSRRGVSFAEFVGCLIALGGGVVLGSIYLGVDVKAMAIVILEKADIEVPAVFTANAPVSTDSITTETPLAGTSETTGHENIADPTTSDDQFEATAAQGENETIADDETVAAAPVRKPLTDVEAEVATQACWLALNQTVQEEFANRSKSIDDPQSWHLFDYLIHRQAGHQKVADAIEKIDQHGVDQRLRMHVQQLLAWHQAGAELYNRAGLLLTDAPAGKLSGPFAQSWQSAATQHRMEEKLVLAKHAAVASYLEHSYK